MINKRKALTKAETDVHQVRNLVEDFLWDLFIQMFNFQVSNLPLDHRNENFHLEFFSTG